MSEGKKTQPAQPTKQQGPKPEQGTKQPLQERFEKGAYVGPKEVPPPTTQQLIEPTPPKPKE